jgi:hypothetical protein
MRTRIRLLAIAVVALGGGTLAGPKQAHATYAPPPQYCCCEVVGGTCVSRCCSVFGCSATSTACSTLTRPPAS